jgi:glycosyltransferase involved in cell wall biosynthesis
MKILLCHNYYQQPGGESEVFENELKGLRRMGIDVILYQRSNHEIEKLSLVGKAKLCSSAYASLRTDRELRALVAKEKPDVALVQNVFPLVSPSAYQTLFDVGLPVIQAVYNYRLICPSAELYTEGTICERCVSGNQVHAVVHRCYRGSYLASAWYASIIGLHHRLKTFAKITSFMVPDYFLGKKLVQGGFSKERIWRNPNPFFVEDYQPRTSHEGYVLFVGRLVAQKGILTLLNAMKHVTPSSRLVVIGQGELADEVEKTIQTSGLSGQISWLGPRWGHELTDLIQKSAAIVIPSEWYDNLPMMLCKANALGKPVIASRINGIPEYVRENENGFLFEPGNIAELAACIDKVLSLSGADYTRLAQSARVYAETELDYPVHYRNLMMTIQQLSKIGGENDPR